MEKVVGRAAQCLNASGTPFHHLNWFSQKINKVSNAFLTGNAFICLYSTAESTTHGENHELTLMSNWNIIHCLFWVSRWESYKSKNLSQNISELIVTDHCANSLCIPHKLINAACNHLPLSTWLGNREYVKCLR